MLKRSSILIGAGIAVALIIGVYGLAPLVFSEGAAPPVAVGSDGPVAERMAASEDAAAGTAGTDAAAGAQGAGASRVGEGGTLSADAAASDGAAAAGAGGGAGAGTGDGAGLSGSGSTDGQGASSSAGSALGSSNGTGAGGGGADAGGSGGSGGAVSGSGSAGTGSTGSDDATGGTTAPAPAPAPAPPSSPSAQLSCTLSVSCSTILGNQGLLDPAKAGLVPSNGVLMAGRSVAFTEGETVFDVLQRETRSSGLHMESSYVPLYNSAYVEGIGNLYEFDVGELSGWMYCVNGWYPNYGCSAYVLADGDAIQWNYTCDLGRDLGVEGVVQG